GDRRIGFYVLLAGGGAAIAPDRPYLTPDNKKAINLDVVADHPHTALAYYLAYDFECRFKGKAPGGQLGDLGGPTDGFIQRLGTYRDLFTGWQLGTGMVATGDGQAAAREKTLKFIGKSPLPVYDWALLDAMCRCGL